MVSKRERKKPFDVEAYVREANEGLRGITKERLDKIFHKAAAEPGVEQDLLEADRIYQEYRAKGTAKRAIPRSPRATRKRTA